MKRIFALFLVMAVLGASSGAQDAESLILTYQRNFVRSSLGTKLELLRAASAEAAQAAEANRSVDMGPLYDTALRFVVENVALLGTDAQLREVANTASIKAGEVGYAKSVERLWSVFELYPRDQELRAVALMAFAKVGKTEARVVERLNTFLSGQTSLFRSGAQPEYPALAACIDALGNLGDGSSFPFLFSAYVAGFNKEISVKAIDALGKIQGDYEAYLKDVITRNSPLEKAAALEAGLSNPKFGFLERGALSEAALAAGLDRPAGDSPVELASIRELKLRAVREIKALGRQKASPLVIRHFRNLLTEYNEGRAPEAELLEAISCLGAMGSIEAAQSLALYLQLINARTEQGGAYDEDILLAVISSLGELGDKTAFDYLLYIGYLQYPESVKRAAKDALQRLKW